MTQLNDEMKTIHGKVVDGDDVTYRYIWVNLLGLCGGQGFTGKDKTEAVDLALRLRDLEDDTYEIDKEEERLLKKVIDNCHLNAATCVFLLDSIKEKTAE